MLCGTLRITRIAAPLNVLGFRPKRHFKCGGGCAKPDCSDLVLARDCVDALWSRLRCGTLMLDRASRLARL